ncbi:hypothetical protein HYT54_02870 [Candidatus Woesearchaeota archaeon]|nr:hypothetical protein [Candidatus Woesearchaeota archaeon]
MKNLRVMAVSVVLLLAVVGMAYGAVVTRQIMADKSMDKVSIEVTKSSTRDFERNIYVVDTDMQSEIMYSVVQSKKIRATTRGLEPSYVLVHRGESVNFNIDSDVNCNFLIDGYRVDAKAWPNTVTEVTFNADLPGIYIYRCAGLFSDRSTVGLLEVVE